MRHFQSEPRRTVCGTAIVLLVTFIAPLLFLPTAPSVIWDKIEEISVDKRIEYQRYPAVAADSGRAYAVWADNGDRDYDIMLREHDGAAWLLEEEVNADDRDIDQFLPDIATDSGTSHIVWHDPINGDYDIMYRRKSGGGWGPIEEVSVDIATEIQQNPAVAAADGNVYVVWQDGRDGDWDIYFRYHDGAAWSSVQQVNVDMGTEAQTFPSVSAGGGRAYVVWEDAGDGDKDIMMRVFDGTSWGPIMEVSQDSFGEVQNVPDAVYDAGKVHVVWEEFRTTDRDIYYRSWDGSAFSSIKEISVDDGMEFQDVPSVDAEFGKVYVVWADRGDGDWDILCRRYDGTSWLIPEEVSVDSGSENQWNPDIAVDNGVIHIVWEDQGDGDNDIFYRKGYESPPTDTVPPDVRDVYLDGSSSQTYQLSALPPSLTLTATLDDSFRGSSVIGGANYTIGTHNWATSTPMIPDDILDTSVEGLHATFSPPEMAGLWTYCTYGWDIASNYNTTGLCASLRILDDMAPIVSNPLIDGMQVRAIEKGTASVTVTVTLDDSSRGGSIIAGANYTSPSQNWLNSSVMIPDDILDTQTEGFHASLDTSLLGLGTYEICAYGWDELLNNNITGSCATLIVGKDSDPPLVTNVSINGQTSVSYRLSSVPVLVLTATLDDSATGGSLIGGANYTIGAYNWSSSTSMIPMDVLDSPIESFHSTLIEPSSSGVWQYCVYGWDSTPNHNRTGLCATLTIYDDLPPVISSMLIDGLPSRTIALGTKSVTVTAIVDDSSRGGSIIAGANYTSPSQNWANSTLMTPNDLLDTEREGFHASVNTDLLSPGTYEICAYGWDEVPNNNTVGSCATLIVSPSSVADNAPPEISQVRIDGANQKSYHLSSLPSSFLLTAFLDESNTGNSTIMSANYTLGQRNWPGITMEPSDSVWDEISEYAEATVSTPTGKGSYLYCVYASDQVGLHNTTGACATLIVFDNPPAIDALSVEPSQAREGEDVDIVVIAADDGTVEEVWIEISGSNGSEPTNLSARYDDSIGGYLTRISCQRWGEYTVRAWVRDDGGNWASEHGAFKILRKVSGRKLNVKPVLALVFAVMLLAVGFAALRRCGKARRLKKLWFLPFLLAELITAAVSSATGSLGIPPALGIGMMVDLLILISGLLMPFLLLYKSSQNSRGPEQIDDAIKASKDPENTK